MSLFRKSRSDSPDQSRSDVDVTADAPAANDGSHPQPDTGDHATEDAGAGAATPRRRRRLVAAGVLVVALGAAGGLTAAAHKTVELDVDGQIHEVSTFSRDIEALLVAEGIEPAERDLVVPAPQERLRDGTQVVVRSAQQIEFQVEGEFETLWTTALTADEALEHLAASGREVAMTASRSSGRAELAMPLTQGGPVQIHIDGEERTVSPSGTADLAGVLRLAEIEINPADRVSLSMGDQGTPVLTVQRVQNERVTHTETIEHESVQRETADLYRGQSRVVAEGADGERTYTSAQVLVDGEVESTKHIGVEVTTEPQDRVVEVGTAVRPAPQPAPTRSSGTSSSGSSGSGSSGSSSSSGSSGSSGSDSTGGGSVSGDVWARLAQCESGGNPRAVSPSGTYHGLYQFSVATWQSVGGSGLPSEASPAEQTQRAQALQARSGWGQWPHCSSVLGLR
ncbi:transglycosylase family protein [Pseudactinotalea sp. Z1739]|uniref:transglycosylase family protein n=1 Tax=Pseudactinotalea sp. Z1739 TaxID=3413028 RepID=UPI003C7988D8